MPEVRIITGEDPPATLLWDTAWPTSIEDGAFGGGDWAIAPADDEANAGGFLATDGLTTAVILCLFTDRRRPDDVEAPDGSDDRRGWHGDTFDLDRQAGERPMGSLLWTLERAPPDGDTARIAQAYAAEALQTLIDQRLVSHFDIEAEVVSVPGRLALRIRAYEPRGEVILADTLPVFG